METYPNVTINDLRARVEEALKDLPGPEPTSLEELTATDYLWRQEVYWTCGQVIEHFRSIRLLIDAGLYGPAATLSRSVHECKIRFDYLVDNENELRDWFEWQWSRDYHQFKEELRYDNMLSADKSRRLHHDARSIELLLGKVPPKRNHPWKSTRKMLEYLHETSEPDDALRFYRWFIKDVSQYVHISSSYAPSPELTTWFTEISVITTLCKAMGLCRDKLFIDTPAGEIATLCDKTLLDMAQNLTSQIDAI